MQHENGVFKCPLVTQLHRFLAMFLWATEDWDDVVVTVPRHTEHCSPREACFVVVFLQPHVPGEGCRLGVFSRESPAPGTGDISPTVHLHVCRFASSFRTWLHFPVISRAPVHLPLTVLLGKVPGCNVSASMLPSWWSMLHTPVACSVAASPTTNVVC